MNFIYLIRLLTSLFIKLDVDNDVDSDTSYGLIRITFSFSTLSLIDSFSCSLFLYNSCISQILSSTYWFPFPLYFCDYCVGLSYYLHSILYLLLYIDHCFYSF